METCWKHGHEEGKSPQVRSIGTTCDVLFKAAGLVGDWPAQARLSKAEWCRLSAVAFRDTEMAKRRGDAAVELPWLLPNRMSFLNELSPFWDSTPHTLGH